MNDMRKSVQVHFASRMTYVLFFQVLSKTHSMIQKQYMRYFGKVFLVKICQSLFISVLSAKSELRLYL